jgi:hypothetical protein
VAARVDRGDHAIRVGVALSEPAVNVPVASSTGVVDKETCLVRITILVLSGATVGIALFVSVGADTSIRVGRGVLNDPLGVDDSFATGVFSAK